MIKRQKASIKSCIIHKVGNKFNGTKNAFSDAIVEADFVDLSKHIVTHLFEQSNSAQIKTGDVLICHFENVQYEDYFTDAIGIFKIENKTEFFQTYLEDNNYDILVQKGIQAKKVDKGCLNIRYPDDSNQHTKNCIELCREFSKEVLQPNFGGQEQSNFLAKTVDFFKENEIVNIDTFKEEVFDEEDKIQLFEDYKKNYETDHKVLIRNQFDVSEIALKKQKQKIKTEIKLDTNIQIKLDVDAPDASAEYLERGYDEEKKMHFYKVFFNDET